MTIYISCNNYLYFQYFGHEKVSILDGGLMKWIKDGFETTNKVPKNQNVRVKSDDEQVVLYVIFQLYSR